MSRSHVDHLPWYVLLTFVWIVVVHLVLAAALLVTGLVQLMR